MRRCPAPLTWEETVRREGAFIRKTLHQQVDRAVHPITEKALEDAGVEPTAARYLVERSRGDPRRLHELVDSVGPFFEELGNVLTMPRERRQKALIAFRERAAAVCPLVLSVIDAATGMREALDRNETRWAMVQAGLELIARGDDGFRRVIDPASGAAFIRRPSVGGFVLESTIRPKDGPPSALRFGGRDD